jgi:hypothetical protein
MSEFKKAVSFTSAPPYCTYGGSGSEITYFKNFFKYYQLQQLYSIKWEDVKKLLAIAYSPIYTFKS